MKQAIIKGKCGGKPRSEHALRRLTSEQFFSALRKREGKSEDINPKILLNTLRGYRKGNFSMRLPERQTCIACEIARAFNRSVELNQLLLKEFERVGKATSREGKLNKRISASTTTGLFYLN